MPISRIPGVGLETTGTASVNTFLRGDNAWAGTITSGTAVASTSGTSIDFTGIPSTAKRITVMFSGVSTNGTSNLIIQLGTGSTTYTTTGYLGAASYIASASAASTQMSTGFMVNNNMTAADIFNGSIALTLLTGNTWSETGVLGRQSSTLTSMSAGSIPLAVLAPDPILVW